MAICQIKQEKKIFDRGVFYDEIIQDGNYDDDIDAAQFDSESSAANIDLDRLLEEIGRRWMNRRKVQTIPMLLPDWKLHEPSIRKNGEQSNIGNDTGEGDTADTNNGSAQKLEPSYPGIMLDLYQTIKIKRKPAAVTIDARTSKRTNKITQIYSKETGELISKERIRYYTDFGGETVHISREEVSEIKKRSNGNPDRASLILLGFKPLPTTSETTTELAFVDKSMFAYPNNCYVKGSKTAFATLHASMLNKNVMGIGELLLRVTALSRLVAIIPQEEGGHVEEDCSEGEQVPSQISSPGFLLIPLAFEDDVRSLPRQHDFVPNNNMVEAAKELIRNIDIGEDIEIGESYENPAMKTFWNYIESVALGTPLEEEFSDDDDTKMNVEGILAAAGEEINAFKATIPESKIESKLPTKRKAKLESVPDETGIDWNREYEMDTFHELRVEELKSYLRSYGERVSGRKDELIERIKGHIRGQT